MTDKRIFVEQRPQRDFAVRRAGSKRASAVEPTQAEAIARARELNPGVAPHVERVRNTARGSPDKWRKVLPEARWPNFFGLPEALGE
jgi:Uncharacterized protein conserved in bacteria (DUF2188)